MSIAILSNAYVVDDIEYPQGLCSHIFVVEDFSIFFLQLSIF